MNRITLLKGIQPKQFSQILLPHNLDLVTARSKSYYTYTYQGRIRGGVIVKIILSWPQKALFDEKTLRCFMSHDLRLSVKQILNHYAKRWPIPHQWRR